MSSADWWWWKEAGQIPPRTKRGAGDGGLAALAEVQWVAASKNWLDTADTSRYNSY